MFRDSETWQGRYIGQVNRFFDQMVRQQGSGVSQSQLKFFLVEGNSRDDTRAKLGEWKDILGDRVTILDHEVHGSAVSSIESEARFRNLSAVGNTALRAARDSGCKYILWVESDFIVPHDLLARLLETASPWTLAMAPVPVFYQNGRKQFYDTWAFRGAGGQRWTNDDLPSLLGGSLRFLPMSSIGSCALLNGDSLREYNLDFGEGCFPELCRRGREHGLLVQCDLTLEIEHPCSVNLNGRLV